MTTPLYAGLICKAILRAMHWRSRRAWSLSAWRNYRASTMRLIAHGRSRCRMRSRLFTSNQAPSQRTSLPCLCPCPNMALSSRAGAKAMNRRTIQSNNRLYTYSPDDPVPVGRRIWGVISVMLTDEITGLQPSGTAFISTGYRDLRPRVAQESSLVGLVGIPVRVFPNLKNQGYTVEFTVGAEGYIPRKGKTSVPQNASFPDSFTPAPLLELDLHRPAVAIRGRTVKVAGKSTQALQGATVQLTGFWPTIVSTSGAPQSVTMLALQPSLYFDR